jgi:hypothetical protein
MSIQEQISINIPQVVHDTIEGETILINLKNGNYYSFDKIGAVIWEIIEKKGDVNKLVNILTKKFNKQGEKIESAIDHFISSLLQENLVVQSTEQASEVLMLSDEIEALVNERISDFEPPVMNKYSDMKDMLLLDPIHDTDEKGWPSGKDN